ncbi:MAG: selenocysteine-specific translation elongation factor, partial [Gemmatimonadetes bacterium]|nr:selenocysteine-specific translation elongation factor [Gemmatimonadota bacterium]
VGIVDVPGHEDFVRTMVAGASGIDLLLLVVDAQEGIRPQTLEHLAIAEQLGVPAGIPVLTKADLPDAEWLELVRQDLQDRLARSSIAFEPVAVVSALTGQGIPELLERLRARAVAAGGPPRRDDLFRMPIDRAFSLAGAGTVVTGTVWSGTVRPGDLVVAEPGSASGRVRSVESFGKPAPAAVPGARTAIGVAGVERAAVGRGQVLVTQGAPWRATEIVDVVLALLPDAPRSVASRTRLRFHHGTAEVMGRAYPRGEIMPGTSGLARIVLEAPMVLRGADRFVVRSYSPVQTIGGGWVADPCPPRQSSWPAGLASPDPVLRLESLVARRPGGVSTRFVPVLTGWTPSEAETAVEADDALVVVSERIGLRTWLTEAQALLMERVQRAHRDDPSMPGLSQETLRGALGAMSWLADAALEGLVGDGHLTRSAGVVAVPGFAPRSAGGAGEVAAVVEAVTRAGLEPPTVRELGERLAVPDLDGAIRIAVSQGQLELLERDRYISREALDRFTAVVREVGAGHGDLSPAALRDRLGLSRKFLIPLLEWADRAGVTRRDATGQRTLVA